LEETIQYLQIITNIIIILLFIGLVILVFTLIKQLKKVSQKVEALALDVKEIKPKVTEAIEKIKSVADSVNQIVAKVNANIEILGTVVNRVKDTADSIIEFEQKIQNQIEPPVLNTLNSIAAVSIGIKTFFQSLKKSRDKKEIYNFEAEDKLVELEDPMDDVNKELEEVNQRLSDLQK